MSEHTTNHAAVWTAQRASGAILAALSMVLSAGAATVDVSALWRAMADATDQGMSSGWQQPAFDDGQWTSVDASGDARIPAADHAVWYRKRVRIPSTWDGGCIYLGIEQAAGGYDLFVNGAPARSCRVKNDSALRSTATDITRLVQCGADATLAIRLQPHRDRATPLGKVVLSNDARALTWESLRLELQDNLRFRTDSEHRGAAQEWYRPAVDEREWSVRTLNKNGWRDWQDVSAYKGEAWYRVTFDLPAAWRGEPVFLQTPAVDGALAIYLNGRLLFSRGYQHLTTEPSEPQTRAANEDDGRQQPCIDLSMALERSGPNLLVLRMTCEKDKRGLRAPLLLAADRRAFAFRNDWKAVTELAKLDPEMMLPGWATGRGATHTIAGSIGGEHECFTAPDGSFSPSNRSYSVTAWVYDCATNTLHAGERLPLDQIRWQLDGGRYPFPQSRWQAGDTTVETSLFVNPASFDKKPCDLVFYRCALTHHGQVSARLKVFIAVVPFSVTREYYAFARGYNPIRRISFDPRWNAAVVNDQLGLFSLKPAAGFGCASMVAGANISDSAMKGQLPAAQSAEDWEGLASGAFMFDLELAPGKADEFQFVMPMEPMKPTPAAADFLRSQEWKKSYSAARDTWKRVFEKTLKLTLPDSDVEEAFNASLAYTLVLQDGDALIPGSFAYNAFWTRDAAYLIDACLRAGLTSTARKAAELWLKFQKPSGEFPSMGSGGPKEWDGQGQVIYALTQIYRFTHDKQWLADHFPSIRKGAGFIASVREQGLTEKNRDTPLWGILTPSVSAEDLGPKDWHFYWDDFWCIRGLQDASFAARELGLADDAAAIDQMLGNLQGSTLESIRQVMQRDHIGWIPVAPENPSASGKARGTTPAIWPGGAFAPGDPLLRQSFDHYWDELIAPKKGGYYHAGQPWPYATLELAHAYLNLGQPARAWQMLRWTLDNQTAPGVYAWAEVADSTTKLFLGGDIPHGWACAEYVSLVRDMLVREVDDAILLTSGVPARWLEHGQRVEVERAPTHFGTVAFKLNSRAAAGEIVLDLAGDARPPGGMYWMIPELPAPVEGVSVDGNAVALPVDRRLSLPAGAKRITLRLKTGPADVRVEPYRARMQAWQKDMTPANVYASVDDQRPLLGVYFYFEGADAATNAARLSAVREAFDFVQIGPTSANVRRCEQAAVPWIGVEQPAIPLGRDSDQWASARGVIRSRTQDYADSSYLLGWNSGSEPHTSFKTPGYTGHTSKLYEDLGVAAPTRSEFIEWLAAEYADASPATDTNHDGVTFDRDFDVHFQNWEEVAQPANRHAPWFEHVLIPFTCKLIHDAEAGRLQAFHDNDPRHAVTPRLLRSLTDPRMSYDLTYLNLGDAAGVTFYCGGGFDMDDPHRTGARVETIGISHEHALRFGVRMTPPSSGRTGLAESSYHVRLPVDGPMEFRCSVRGENGYDGECRIELVDDATRPDMPGTILERLTAGDAFTPVTVDLSAHAGRRVWLRLVSDGGREVRSPATQPNQTAPKAYWLEPRVEAAGRVACDLIEFYKEARAGYRLYDDAGQPGPLVFLGLRGSMYQVWYADQVMSLVANRARLAGKRAVANEFHPGSGSPHAMFPLAIYDSMIRLMQFRCPSVAYFCHMYQGEFASYSMANSQEHVARARNQAMLWQAYANVPQRRRSKVACFMPSNFATPQQASEAADRFGTRSALIGALGELGADVYLLNDLDQAADYDKLVIFLAYADREAEAKLHALLKSDLTGKRVIVLTSVSKLWGPVGRRVSQRIDADLAEVLPVIPVGERMVQKTAEVMPGLRATLHLADTVRVQALPGFTNLHADDGTVIGARSENLLVLAGYPDTPANEKLSRGWFDTSMRRLIHGWLNVEPGLIDMGSIRMVSRDFRADSPAIYSVENSSLLELGRGLAAYDVLHQYPVTARAAGPAVIRAWRVDEPKLVDSDLCEPVRVLEQVEHIAVTLVAPAFLKASRPQQLTFYWPQAKPDVRMDGQAVGTEDLGAGFYCIAAPSPGVHCLEITGAGSTRPSAD